MLRLLRFYGFSDHFGRFWLSWSILSRCFSGVRCAAAACAWGWLLRLFRVLRLGTFHCWPGDFRPCLVSRFDDFLDDPVLDGYYWLDDLIRCGKLYSFFYGTFLGWGCFHDPLLLLDGVRMPTVSGFVSEISYRTWQASKYSLGPSLPLLRA